MLPIIATIALLGAQQPRPDFRILLVGLGPYESKHIGLVSLSGATDCKNLEASLKKFYPGLTDANFCVIQGDAATKEAIEEKFKDWLVKDAKSTDKLVFFFSGHGTLAWDRNKKPCSAVIPIDAKRLPNESFVNDSLITRDFFNDELTELKSKGATNITMIFDCCNSGSIARGTTHPKGAVNQGIPAPTDDYPSLDFGDAAVITAARADREAYETDNDGGNLTVAITRAFSDRQADRTAQGPFTYKELQDRMLANMASLAQDNPQDPAVKINNLNREVFGSKVVPTEAYYRTELNQDGKLMIDGGEIFGLTKGCRVSIYPSGTTSFDSAKPLATAKIASPDTYESELEVEGGFKPLSALNGCRARVIDATPDARVSIDLADLKASGKYSDLVSKLQSLPLISTKLGELGYVHIAPPGETSKGDAKFPSSPTSWILSDAGGRKIGEVAAGASDAVESGIESYIRDVGRKQAVLALKTPDPWLKVEIQVVPTKYDLDANGRTSHITALLTDQAAGSGNADQQTRVAVRVRCTYPDGHVDTRTTEEAQVSGPYIAILDVTADGKVSQLFPQSGPADDPERRRLRPDGEWRYLGVNNDLVDAKNLTAIVPWIFTGDAAGQEIFKICATDQNVSYMPLLTVNRSGEKGAGDETSLARTLKAFRDGTPVSRAGGDAPEPSEFAVASVVIVVKN